MTTTYSVTPTVRHNVNHPTADDAAVTSSRLAVRTLHVIINEKFLDLGGGEIRKRVLSRYGLRVRLLFVASLVEIDTEMAEK